MGAKNFSIETYLEYNLGPLYKLDTLVDRMLDVVEKDFFFKKDDAGAFVTRNFRDKVLGTAVNTYRQNQREQDRFSDGFWIRDGCKKDLHLHKYPWWLMNFNSDRVIASYRYRISSLGPANSIHLYLMGDYTIIDETINGRLVYRSDRGSYLFMNSLGEWIVRHGDFRDEDSVLYQDSNYSLGPISDEPWKYWVEPSSDASSDDSDDSDDYGWLSDDATLKCHGWQM